MKTESFTNKITENQTTAEYFRPSSKYGASFMAQGIA